MKSVLFVSPYAAWSLHTVFETTLGHALRLRGAKAEFLTCDGLLPACGVFRPTVEPRTEASCRVCQAHQAKNFAQNDTDFEWLGGFVPRHIYAEARAFVDALPAEKLLETRWKGMEIGRWVQSSVFSFNRTNGIDLSDPDHIKTARDHLYGGIVATEGLQVALDEKNPDAVVMLNGRFFVHWAAYELAQARGIRVITHERGLRKNTMKMAVNARSHDLCELEAIWEAWKDIALPEVALAYGDRVLSDRRYGKNYTWNRFSPPPEDSGQLRTKLGLDERPIVAVFTSSSDETVAFPERRAGAFPEPADFMPAVLDYARTRPDVQFVIRIHPNVSSIVGTNQQEMEHALAMKTQAPENVVVVMPKDDVSSYTLADIASAGVVYASTIGLEMACTGLPVVVTAQSTWVHAGFAERVWEPEHFGAAIGRALEKGRQPEIARMAMRWAVHFFKHWAMPFRQVIEEPPHIGQITWSELHDLAPEQDPTLDRMCAAILDGTPVYRLPTRSDAERSQDAEDAWLERSLFSGATENAVSTADTLVQRGEKLFSDGDHTEAAKCFAEACRVDPQHADSWNNLGVLLHLMGQTDAALDALERSVALDAKAASRVVNLARVLAAVGRKDEAFKLATDTVSRLPEQAEGWAFLEELAESA